MTVQEPVTLAKIYVQLIEIDKTLVYILCLLTVWWMVWLWRTR